jgi:hypothetical protein
MASITIRCPSCKEVYVFGANKVGRKIRCIECGALMLVPDAPPSETASPGRGPTPRTRPTQHRTPSEEEEGGSYGLAGEPTAPPPASKKQHPAGGKQPPKETAQPAKTTPPKRPPDSEEEPPEEEDAEIVQITKRRGKRRPQEEEEQEEEEALEETREEEEPPTKRGARRRRERDEEEDEEESVEKKRKRRRVSSRTAALRKVRLGLILLLVTPAIVVLIWIMAAGAFLFSSRTGAVPGIGGLLAMLRIMLIGTLIQEMVAIAAYSLFLFVPARNVPRRLALTTVGVSILCSVVSMLFIPVVFQGFMPGWVSFDTERLGQTADRTSGLERSLVNLNVWVASVQVLAVLIQLLSYAKLVALPIFLGELSYSLDANWLGEYCGTLFKLNVATIVLGVLPQLLFRVGLGVLLFLLMPFSCISFLIHIAQFIWYVVILFRLQGVVAAQMDR